MRCKRLATSILCLAIHAPAWCAGLPDIYRLAKDRAPEVRAAAAALSATDAVRDQSLRALLPTLTASAEAAKNKQDVIRTGVGTEGNFDFDSRTYALTLRQPLFRQDLFSRLGQTSAQAAQAQAEHRALQQAFIVRVAERYFETLAAQDNIEFARANREAAERQLEQMRARHSIGTGALTDLRELEANYDLSVAQQIEAESRLTSAEEALRELTGDYPENLSRLKTHIPLLLPDPPVIDAWRRRAELENQKLVAALSAVQVAEKEVSRQQAGHYPSLDLVGTKSDTANDDGRFGESRIKDSIVALQLNVPLFASGQVSARVREAEERRIESQERAEQQRRAVIRQASDAYRAVSASTSRISALKRLLTSTETALDAIQAGYRAGTRTAVDVIGAQRTHLRTRRDYATERYTYVVNTLRLKEAAGTLSPDDVTTLADWFE